MEDTIKQDLLDHVKEREIKCATISKLNSEWGRSPLSDLSIGYSKEEYDLFIESLDIQFHSGYGTQEVYGFIWYKDGTWSSRGEYDGSEWWEYNECPEIPESLNQ